MEKQRLIELRNVFRKGMITYGEYLTACGQTIQAFEQRQPLLPEGFGIQWTATSQAEYREFMDLIDTNIWIDCLVSDDEEANMS